MSLQSVVTGSRLESPPKALRRGLLRIYAAANMADQQTTAAECKSVASSRLSSIGDVTTVAKMITSSSSPVAPMSAIRPAAASIHSSHVSPGSVVPGQHVGVTGRRSGSASVTSSYHSKVTVRRRNACVVKLDGCKYTISNDITVFCCLLYR